MANAETPREKAPAALQKLRLREDVNLIYASPTTGKGQVRVVDPRNGRQFSFDEREFLLLRSADGTADVETVHQRLQAEPGVPFSLSEVKDFFRRMQILGLFEAAPAEVAPNPPVARRGLGAGTFGTQGARASADPSAATSGPRNLAAKAAPTNEPAKSGPRQVGSNFGRNDAARVPVIRSVNARPATESAVATGLGRPARSAPKVVQAEQSQPGSTRDVAATPAQIPAVQPLAVTAPQAPAPTPQVDPPVMASAAVVAPPLAPAVEVQPRSLLSETVEPQPAANDAPPQAAKPPQRDRRFKMATSPAKPAEPEVVKTVDVRADRLEKAKAARAKAKKAAQEAAILDAAAVQTAAPPASVDAPLTDTAPSQSLPAATAQAGPGSDPAAGVPPEQPTKPAAQTVEDDLAVFDFLDSEFDDLDAGGGGLRGGRFGGGMGGGFRGGMMGGAKLGGGQTGGGMAGGGGNGERLLAALAARGGAGGGMGGGMRAGMGARQPEPVASTKPAELPLFNPEPLLRLLYILFYPLKLILWAIVPMVVVAGLAVFNNLQAFREDTVTNLADFSSVTQFLLGLFVVNLISRLAQGVAIVAHGGQAKKFGVSLALGVIPRFYVDKQGLAEMDRRAQLWAYGAPLLARLALFAIGILFWATNRDQGGMLPQISLITAKFGLVMFVVTACPLVPSDGLRWFSVLFNEPRLAGKAAAAFKHVFLGGNLPPMITKADALPLALFGVAVALTSVALVGVIGLSALLWLEAELGGMGVIFFLGIAAAFTLWLLATFASIRGRAGGGGRAFDAAAFRKMTLGDDADEAEVDADGQAATATAPAMPARARVIWTLIAVGLLALAFQPYAYESGGPVEISPAARGQAVARTDGEIVEVMVKQGDLVEQGQTVARLSFWDQQSEIAVTEAQLQGAQANLDRIEAGKKPEEVELVRRELASAEADLLFVQTEAERARDLAATGTVSQSTLEKADGNLASALAKVDVARAKLALVESGATAEEMAIARATVEELERELAFQRDELERTRIVAPISGRVITADLNLRQGGFLRAGETLIEIERADLVAATISVPESDITLIQPGRVVRLKVYGQSGDEIVGAVQSIAPAAENAGYGRIVRVTAEFRNDDGFLRSGMTGYAKIESAEMRVWEAYLRSITRFFQIEVWSWIP